jgi:hypothetical protein
VANSDGIGFGLTEGHIIMSAQDSYGVWTFFYLSDQCSHGYMEEKKVRKKCAACSSFDCMHGRECLA